MGGGTITPRQSIYDAELEKNIESTPMGALRVSKTTRLVGTTFGGAGKSNAVDDNFWTATPTANGTCVQSGGNIALATTVDSGSAITVQSIRTARYIGASSNFFRSQARFTTAPTANNVRRIGCFDANNGAFFEVDATGIKIVTRTNASGSPADTAVAVGSWNRLSSWTLDTALHTFEIYFTNKSVYFVIDDVLVHKVTASTTAWASILDFPVRIENVNTGVGSVVAMNVRVATISRLGESKTRPIYKNLSGTTGGITYKYSSGTLHGVVINAAAGGTSVCSIYDALSATNPIAKINIANSNISGVTFGIDGLDFYTGLYVVVTNGSGTSDLTFIYE